MPLFEYECESCRKRFEYLQRRAGAAPQKCPHCAGRKLRKVFSGFSVAASGSARTGCSSAAAACPSGTCPYASS